jgi:hypothetical protein
MSQGEDRLKGYRPGEPSKIERIPAGGYSYVTTEEDDEGDSRGEAAKIPTFSMSVDDTSKTDKEYFDKIIDANSPRNRGKRKQLQQQQQQHRDDDHDSTKRYYYYGAPPPQTASREHIAALLEGAGKGNTKVEIVQSRSRCPYCAFMTWNRYALARHVYDHPEESAARLYKYRMEHDYKALISRKQAIVWREQEVAREKSQLLEQLTQFESCDDTKDIAVRINEGKQAQDSKEDVLTAALNPVG